jgi:hypothetical protein
VRSSRISLKEPREGVLAIFDTFDDFDELLVLSTASLGSSFIPAPHKPPPPTGSASVRTTYGPCTWSRAASRRPAPFKFRSQEGIQQEATTATGCWRQVCWRAMRQPTITTKTATRNRVPRCSCHHVRIAPSPVHIPSRLLPSSPLKSVRSEQSSRAPHAMLYDSHAEWHTRSLLSPSMSQRWMDICLPTCEFQTITQAKGSQILNIHQHLGR